MSALAATSPGEWAIAAATMLGAIGAFVTVIANLKQGKRNAAKIDTVHELVNDRSEKQDKRIEQLGGALADAGVEIPPKPANETAS